MHKHIHCNVTEILDTMHILKYTFQSVTVKIESEYDQEAIKLMQCIIMEKHSNQITHHDETKKRAHNSQIDRAKENLKLSHGGSSYR